MYSCDGISLSKPPSLIPHQYKEILLSLPLRALEFLSLCCDSSMALSFCNIHLLHPNKIHFPLQSQRTPSSKSNTTHTCLLQFPSIRCCNQKASSINLRTCKNCKTQFDPALNHPRACRFHTAHYGGETKRKFESVYEGGTMNTPGSGKVLQYWHCCGSEDPFDPGCTASPHSSYDD